MKQPIHHASPQGPLPPLAEQDAPGLVGPFLDRVQSLRLDKSRLSSVRHRGKNQLFAVAAMTAVAVVGYLALGLPRLLRDVTSNAGTHAAAEIANEVDDSLADDDVLEASGHIAVRTKVQVTCRVSGVVTELLFAEGQSVRQGDVLARLEATLYDAEVAEAKSQLALAQANLQQLHNGSRPEEICQAQAALTGAKLRREFLQRESQRMTRLQNNVSQREHDLAELDLGGAEARVTELAQMLRLLELGPRLEQISAASAEVDRAQAQLSKAQYRQSCTAIVAPVDGIVLERKIELGERVGTELQPGGICVLADTSALEVVLDIHERDLERVRLGQACVITTDADPQRHYDGQLQWLSPVMDRQRSVRAAKIPIAQPYGSLFPDMNCRVAIHPATRAAAPCVVQD